MSSFLDELNGDTGSLKECVTELKRLRYEMMMAEEAFKEKQKAYSDYAIKTLPEKFSNAGVTSMECEDGSKLVLTSQCRASVVKDKKKNVATWLREHNAEDLVTANLVVPEAYKDTLRANNIAFDENLDMNTNKVKSLVKEMLDTGSITQGELPDGLSWYQWNEVIVK